VSAAPQHVAAPESLVIAGDWHGNLRWAEHVIATVAPLLPPAGTRLILHLGDFGIWPRHESYVRELSRSLTEQQITLWFVDGNHEDHDRLDQLHAGDPGPVSVDDAGLIWHLPRGTRWEWHGRTWLAVGGAGSPDRPMRVASVSWWPQETITPEQAQAIIADGPADVLICHDCPRGLMPAGMPEPPSWWDMPPCHASAARLQDIADAVRPSQILHGHLHLTRDDLLDAEWGTVRVRGLDMDGTPGNWSLISTRSLEEASPDAPTVSSRN
jgi:hypothetical protein